MGASAKITPQQVWIITAVLCVISVVVIYFTMIKPANENFGLYEADYKQQLDTYNKYPAARTDRAKTEQAKAQATADWAVYDHKFMPNIDLTNRYTAMRQLWNEEIFVLPEKVDRFLHADHAVDIVSATLAYPQPPNDPNAVVTKQYTFALGSVSVVGTFNAVLADASRWNNFGRLTLMDNLSLSGNSPRLEASYTLTVFEFTHNFDTVGPVFATAAAPTGGGSGGMAGGPGANFTVGGRPGGGGGGPMTGPSGGPMGGGGGKIMSMSPAGAGSLPGH